MCNLVSSKEQPTQMNWNYVILCVNQGVQMNLAVFAHHNIACEWCLSYNPPNIFASIDHFKAIYQSVKQNELNWIQQQNPSTLHTPGYTCHMIAMGMLNATTLLNKWIAQNY